MPRSELGEINDLKKLEKLMAAKGAERLLVKKLSPNDNSKNQIYLGGDYESLNLIPNKGVYVDTGRDISKRDRFKADIFMSWLDGTGALYRTPNAQLILYPKYPEVRLSGFLTGCEKAPSKEMASRNPGRMMFFGICRNGAIICHVTSQYNPVYAQLAKRPNLETSGVFINIPLLPKESGDTQDALVDALREIHLAGWIKSVKLDANGRLTDCSSPNCGGYTLEARLGVKPNGYSLPDFLGWEVKQHGVSSFAKPHSGGPITLMTPEPTGGIYREKGPEVFLRKFGYADRTGRKDRVNFGGTFKFNITAPLTKLTLQLPGYDVKTGKITNPDGGLTLLSDHGEEAATWHFADMMRIWNRKHAKAVYVPSLCKTAPQRLYRYGNLIELGIGTDFLKFLAAIACGKVYYDPGIKLENASTKKPLVKRRSQFRIKPADLRHLYHQSKIVDILSS